MINTGSGRSVGGGKGLVHSPHILYQKKGCHLNFCERTKKALLVVAIAMFMSGCGNPVEEIVEQVEAMSVSNPQSSDFNRYFSELGRQVDVVIPHEFMPGERFDQEKVNENFDAVLEGLYEMKQRAEFNA